MLNGFTSLQVIHLIKEKSSHERVPIAHGGKSSRGWIDSSRFIADQPYGHLGSNSDRQPAANGNILPTHSNSYYGNGLVQNYQTQEYRPPYDSTAHSQFGGAQQPAVIWAAHQPLRIDETPLANTAPWAQAAQPMTERNYVGHQPYQTTLSHQLSNGNGAADYYFPSEQSQGSRTDSTVQSQQQVAPASFPKEQTCKYRAFHSVLAWRIANHSASFATPTLDLTLNFPLSIPFFRPLSPHLHLCFALAISRSLPDGYLLLAPHHAADNHAHHADHRAPPSRPRDAHRVHTHTRCAPPPRREVAMPFPPNPGGAGRRRRRHPPRHPCAPRARGFPVHGAPAGRPSMQGRAVACGGRVSPPPAAGRGARR